jgi:hypothetical protein
MAERVRSGGTHDQKVDEIDDLFIEIEGVRLKKRQQLQSILRGLLKRQQ